MTTKNIGILEDGESYYGLIKLLHEKNDLYLLAVEAKSKIKKFPAPKECGKFINNYAFVSRCRNWITIIMLGPRGDTKLTYDLNLLEMKIKKPDPSENVRGSGISL